MCRLGRTLMLENHSLILILMQKSQVDPVHLPPILSLLKKRTKNPKKKNPSNKKSKNPKKKLLNLKKKKNQRNKRKNQNSKKNSPLLNKNLRENKQENLFQD